MCVCVCVCLGITVTSAVLHQDVTRRWTPIWLSFQGLVNTNLCQTFATLWPHPFVVTFLYMPVCLFQLYCTCLTMPVCLYPSVCICLTAPVSVSMHIHLSSYPCLCAPAPVCFHLSLSLHLSSSIFASWPKCLHELSVPVCPHQFVFVCLHHLSHWICLSAEFCIRDEQRCRPPRTLQVHQQILRPGNSHRSSNLTPFVSFSWNCSAWLHFSKSSGTVLLKSKLTHLTWRGHHSLCEKLNGRLSHQVIMSLEEDASGQKMQLAYRLQQVAALVENKVTDLWSTCAEEKRMQNLDSSKKQNWDLVCGRTCICVCASVCMCVWVV